VKENSKMKIKKSMRIVLGFSVIALAALSSGFTLSGQIPPGAYVKQPVNYQTGTTYTFVHGDAGGVVSFANTYAIVGTLGQAGTASFPSGWHMDVQNTGAGSLTITPTTSTIDGAATLVLTTGCGAHIVSDGTNWASVHSCGGGGGGLNAWTAITVPTPTGWTQTSGKQSAGFAVSAGGIVHLRGELTAGTNTNGTVVFTLPSGFRPTTGAEDFIVWGASTTALAVLTVNTDGTVVINSFAGIAPAGVGLGAISFPVN
jgi:hypothetical protein